MFFDSDINTVTHGIQLAVAPVFLLTAVSGLIAAVAGRLARIIDRARILDDRLMSNNFPGPVAKLNNELKSLKKRATLVNGSIALLTFCAILIGITIVVLFLGETTALQMLRLASICFLAGLTCFLLALLSFLAETLLATQVLNFNRNTSS